MIKYCGTVKGRFKGEYTDRNGEVREKVVYLCMDDSGSKVRITDFEREKEPFRIDEKIEVSVDVSAFITKDNKARYNLVLKNADAYSSPGVNLIAF